MTRMICCSQLSEMGVPRSQPRQAWSVHQTDSAARSMERPLALRQAIIRLRMARWCSSRTRVQTGHAVPHTGQAGTLDVRAAACVEHVEQTWPQPSGM